MLMSMPNTAAPSRARTSQRGLSMVELMVGVVVGLFVVAGAVKLFTDYLGSNRNLLLQTRINQDLRAAADLIARDLRRGGYWRNATAGVSLDPLVPPLQNPYRTVAYNGGTGELTYSYAKDNVDALDAATEGFGVKQAWCQAWAWSSFEPPMPGRTSPIRQP